MRRMRDALYAAGYVKHEGFVLPENKPLFKELEKRLRQPLIAGEFKLESYMTADTSWNTKRLFDALGAVDAETLGDVQLSLVEGAEQAIKIEMKDFGGLPIFIVVAGEQIIVDTLLVGADEVIDEPGFKDAVLRSREMFPLSSIGIETMPNGESAYNMFGALSATSTLTNVVTEILTLAENVQRAVVAFDQFFRK
ncbi:TPA: YjfI family protein [Pseudomonas aeruginosa]